MRRLVICFMSFLLLSPVFAHGGHFEIVPCSDQDLRPFGNQGIRPTNDEVLLVGRARTGEEHHGLLHFDLGGLSSHAGHLISARLFLRMLDASEDVVVASSSQTLFNWMGQLVDLPDGHVYASRHGKYQVADVTDIINSWLAGETTSEGIVVLPVGQKLLLFFGKGSQWSPYLQLEFDTDIRGADLRIVSARMSSAPLEKALIRAMSPGRPFIDEARADDPGEIRWSGLTEGVYHIEAYGASSPVFPGETVITSACALVRNGESSTISVKPDMPRFERSEFRNPSSGVTLKRGQGVPAGSEVLVELEVFNPHADSQRVRARVAFDRNHITPYDGEMFTLPAKVGPGTPAVPSGSTPSLSEPGSYGLAVEIQTFVDGRWVRTDSREWKRHSTGEIVVTPLSLLGEVRDGISGNPVGHVHISVKESFDARTQADRSGRFSLDGLAAGEYIITFTKEGYSSTDLRVLLPRAYPAVVTLSPAGGERVGLRP